MPITWDRDSGLTFILTLSELLKPRYYLGLTGSVLIKGSSTKDMDLIVYPASSADQDKLWVEQILRGAGLKKLYDKDIVQARWRSLGSQDEKIVEVWEFEGKRVDFFFLS